MKLNDTIENTEVETKIEKVIPEAPAKLPILKDKKAPVATPVTAENLEQLIPEWKALYGKVFKNTVDDDEFVIWRPIKRKEYKQLLDADEEVEILAKQEAIAKMAILYPANASDLIDSRAGLATVLSEEILKYSGFEISATESL
jgi:hypothetical protein